MNTKRITILGLTMLTVCSLASCANSQGREDAKEVTFTLKAKYVDNTKMAGYKISVKNSAGAEVSSGKTDKYGMYTWSAFDNDSYTATFTDLPKGYIQEELIFNKDTTYVSTTITSSVIVDELPKNYVYSTPGEIAYDYTLTDYKDSSVTYNFRKLLKKKSFIMLNFFYIGCDPCKSEFPAIEKAYQNYKDKMELIAIDVYTTQTASQLDNYRTNTLGGISFPMCFDKGNALANIFDSRAVPTTAIIDRYGRIDFWSYGAETEQSKWEARFAKYSADDYEIGTPEWMAKDW